MIATALASRHIAVNKKYKKERKRIKYNLSDWKRCVLSSAGKDTEKWVCREVWEYKLHRIFDVLKVFDCI